MDPALILTIVISVILGAILWSPFWLYRRYRNRNGQPKQASRDAKRIRRRDDTEIKAKVDRVLTELQAEYGTIANLPRDKIVENFGFFEYQKAHPYIQQARKADKAKDREEAKKNKILAKTKRARGEHHLANGGAGAGKGGIGAFVGVAFDGDDE